MFGLALPEELDARQAALRLADQPGLCWLDGDPAHDDGRFAFVAASPSSRVRIRWPAAHSAQALAAIEADVLARGRDDAPCALPGAPTPQQVPRYAGYIAYDAALTGELAPALASALSRTRERSAVDRRAGVPVLDFARYDAVLAFDLQARRAFVLGDDEATCTRLRDLVLRAPQPLPATRVRDLRVSDDRAHIAAIERALAHIAAGDVYQVNLARTLTAQLSGSPLALFLALRQASPVPLGMYYDDGERVIAARTMERFLRWSRDERSLLTRPIKGTAARTPGQDDSACARLVADEKERAEHAMIVDLMRNDLSRIAELGSVRVDGLFAVEPFSRLWHLVSSVRCTTRAATTLPEVLAATFPPGSVTGAPKLSAMALIEALEQGPRDAYTGALGFVDRAGGLSLAVAIRTAIVRGSELRYFTGGGIVEASDPARELAETVLKARVLHDAAALLEAKEAGALAETPVAAEPEAQPEAHVGAHENLGMGPILR